MKLTITEGYKPTTYEVNFEFELDISDADSLNHSTKKGTWIVLDSDHQYLASSASVDVAMIQAGVALSDRAFMKRLKEEDEARAKIQNKIEAKKLAKTIAKIEKKNKK